MVLDYQRKIFIHRYNNSFVLKKKEYIIITIIIAALLPSLVFAAVVIQSTTDVSPTGVTGPIYFAEGPDYAAAHALGFALWTVATPPSTVAATITAGFVNNASYTELVDVLEIVNDTGQKLPTSYSLSVSADGSSTTPYVYYSSSPVTTPFPTQSNLGNLLTTSPTTITTITTSGVVEYLSIYLLPGTSSAVTITLTYEIG